MTNRLIKSPLFPNKNKNKIEPGMKDDKLNLPLNLQTIQLKLLSGNDFVVDS